MTKGDERYFYHHCVYKMPGHLPGHLPGHFGVFDNGDIKGQVISDSTIKEEKFKQVILLNLLIHLL